MLKIIDYYNVIAGGCIAFFTAIFGVYWYLFAIYLVLNMIDWLTGWYKARKCKKESSAIGLRGIVKKLGYWVILAVAFIIPELLIDLGNHILHIDLNFLTLIGWFTLAMLSVNEARSILENMVECGYAVPDFLIKGLAITEKLLQAGIDRDNSSKQK